MFSWSIRVCLSAYRVHPRTWCNRRVWLIGWHSLSKFHFSHFNTNDILNHQNKIQMLFSFPFQINWFYWSTGKRGNKKQKKGVTGQDYIGGGYCHVHHVVLLTPLSWLLFCYKNCGVPSCGGTVSRSTDAWRASWWLEKAHRICGKCVWMLCKKGKYVCVCMWVSWMRGFTSVPLSLWGQVPPTLVRACPCGRLHLQTPKKQPIRQRHTLITSQQATCLKQCCNT